MICELQYWKWGVGGYFGGNLTQAGEDVLYVARGDHLQALKEKGLRIDAPDGSSAVFPVQATDNPKEIGVVDGVILGVKAWQVADVAPALKPLMGPGIFVLPLQNGVEAPMILSEQLGREHVFGGLYS